MKRLALLLAVSTPCVWANSPASLFDMDSIKALTLDDLGFTETVRYMSGDSVLVILGDWSNGDWNTFDAEGNPQTITLHQRTALYVPAEHGGSNAGFVYAIHFADEVECNAGLMLAAALRIPVLVHGEYASDWESLGYADRNTVASASFTHIMMVNPYDSTDFDFVTGNYHWLLPFTNMCAVSLLVGLAQEEGVTVERVAIFGHSKEGGAVWTASAVDDRIDVAAPGGSQLQNLRYALTTYSTDWNWIDNEDNYLESLHDFYEWLLSTPAGAFTEELMSVELFKGQLYPRFFYDHGDVGMYGMHDDRIPLGADNRFLSDFAERNWRFDRTPHSRESYDARRNRLLYLIGSALFMDNSQIDAVWPKVISVEADITQDRDFQIIAFVEGEKDSVILWYNHSDTRRWNEETQAPWDSVVMESYRDGSYRSPWLAAPEDEEIVYYVEVEKWIDAGGFNFPRRDASPVQFLWHTPSVGIKDEENSSQSLSLLKLTCPNLFNRTALIRYQILATGRVSLKIYDATGRHVLTLVDEVQSAGEHSIIWDAEGLTSGVYFCRLEINKTSDIQKLLLLR